MMHLPAAAEADAEAADATEAAGAAGAEATAEGLLLKPLLIPPFACSALPMSEFPSFASSFASSLSHRVVIR
jgi:hypothetical protein